MSSSTPSSQTASSSAPFFTTNPPTPSSGSSGTSSSSLYLFTFLATLFLLLFISCIIILRSFILRRRYRRNFEYAIANGGTPPTQWGARREHRDFGEKPKFYDAWVEPGGEVWQNIMPLSAHITPKPSSMVHTPKSIEDAPSTTTTTDVLPSLNPFTNWRWPRRTSPSSNCPSHDQLPSTSANPSPRVGGEEGNVQVSVLVAMPSPTSKSFALNANESEVKAVPEMVVGVTQLPYRMGSSSEVPTSKLDGGGN